MTIFADNPGGQRVLRTICFQHRVCGSRKRECNLLRVNSWFDFNGSGKNLAIYIVCQLQKNRILIVQFRVAHLHLHRKFCLAAFRISDADNRLFDGDFGFFYIHNKTLAVFDSL